jgi:hypothetical protein
MKHQGMQYSDCMGWNIVIIQWYIVMMWNETPGNAMQWLYGMKHGGIKWYIVIIQWYIVMMLNETPGNAI